VNRLAFLAAEDGSGSLLASADLPVRRPGRWSSMRHIALAAALALTTCGTLGCSASIVSNDREQERVHREVRVESAFRSFYTALARAHPGSSEVEAAVHVGDLRIVPDAGPLRDRAALLDWLGNLRSEYPVVQFEMSKLHIDSASDASYRVHFEIERNGVDDDGLAHVLRSDQSWRIRESVDLSMEVVGIQEQPKLAFTGTGPQIVCY